MNVGGGEQLLIAPGLAVMPPAPVELPAVRCRRCNRALKDALSIAEGIGPSCARKEAVDTKTVDWVDNLLERCAVDLHPGKCKEVREAWYGLRHYQRLLRRRGYISAINIARAA